MILVFPVLVLLYSFWKRCWSCALSGCTVKRRKAHQGSGEPLCFQLCSTWSRVSKIEKNLLFTFFLLIDKKCWVNRCGLRFLSSLALFHPRLLPSLHSSSKETELRNVPSDPSDLFEVAVQRVLGLHAGHFLFGGAKRSFVSNFSWAKSDVTGVVFFFSWVF